MSLSYEQMEMYGAGVDDIATQYETYEDYLDEQITPIDMYYLEDVDLARQLVELGYRGSGEVMKREEFEERRQQAEISRQRTMRSPEKRLVSAGKDVSDYPLLQALAKREEALRSAKLATIVFIRDRNARDQEVSGYIDMGHRFNTEDMEPIFEGSQRLLPTPKDLSYYNWRTQKSSSHSTTNFQVVCDDENGLQFKNKRDRKVIYLDPQMNPGDNTTRTELETEEHLQVVIFDHVTRRRS